MNLLHPNNQCIHPSCLSDVIFIPSLLQPYWSCCSSRTTTYAVLELWNVIIALCVTTFCLVACFLPHFIQPFAKMEPSQRDPPAHSIWNITLTTCITVFSLTCLIVYHSRNHYLIYSIFACLSLLIHSMWTIAPGEQDFILFVAFS